MNSRPHAIYADRLEDAAYISDLLSLFGADPAAASEDVVTGMRELRDALEPAISRTDQLSASAGWRAVSRFSTDVLFRFRFADDGTPVLEPATGGNLSGRMLATLSQVLENGAWSRIKECANEECSSFFFDDTKNRSQRWHSYEICGNKINAAAHRARKTAADT